MIVLADFDKVGTAFGQFSWWFLIPVLTLVLVSYLVRAERWHSYLVRVGLELPRRRSYNLFFAGLSMSATPGKIGEALKAVLLRVERDAPLERGIGIVFMERLSDVIGMTILIGVGTFAFPYWIVSFVVLLLAVAGIIVLIRSERLSGRLVDWLKGRRRLGNVGRVLEAPLKDSRRLLSPGSLLQGTILSVVAWGMESLAFYLVLSGCSVQVGLMESVFIYSFSSVVGAVSMLPGGMGTTEATMVGLLLLQGVVAHVASFAVLLIRVSTLWFAVTVGLVFLTFSLKKRAEDSAPAQESELRRH